MDHFPRFFTHSQGSSPIDPKRSRRKPKLERRNAIKNIEYDGESFSFSLDDSSDVRVEGMDGGFGRLCRVLGVSGPEDFGISADAWEAHKVRSNIQSRSRFHRLDSPDEKRKGKVESEIVVADICDRVVDNDAELNRDDLAEFSCNSSRIEDAVDLKLSSSVASSGGGASGIKGLRPAVLKPPPAMTLPLFNNACSTWDLFRGFAPNDKAGLSTAHLSFPDEEHEGGGRAEGDVGEEICRRSAEEEQTRGRIGEAAVLSASSSFSTTNDDDSFSNTTEPTPYISPIGRFKRIISDDWQKGELLGRGSFGTVYEGIDYDGFFFATKEVSLLDQGSQGKQSLLQLEQEIDLLSKFEHENIVQYYGTSKDESNLYIFLELVTKGSLLSLYQKYNLRDSQVSAYTRQILLGLKYLHDRNVVHRDIKCANILVDASGSVKLADFGLAKATKVNDVKSCKGTAFWMAPEVVNLRNQGYGLPADIWSLGCTVLEMLTRQIPFSHLECMQALFRIGKGQPPPIPDSLSKDARDFILQCLEVNPNKRPTAAQLLHHPFLKRPLPTSSGSVSPHFGR